MRRAKVNSYAYSEIAIYGKDYFIAASDTYSLFQPRGFDNVINDSLLEGVMLVI